MLPARARTPNLLRLLCALVVVSVVLERVHAFLQAGPTDFDDAYMYLRYAHNALAGHWLVWNPGEAPVYGVTSLLQLVLVTLLRGLLPGQGDAAILQIASGAAALALLAALVALCAQFSRDVDMGTLRGFAPPFGPPRPPPPRSLRSASPCPPAMVRRRRGRALRAGRAGWAVRPEGRRAPHATRLHGNYSLWGAVLLPLLCYREAFFFHAHTGMDTMLAALANTAVVFASLRLAEKPSRARALAAAGVGLLAIEARPDNVIIAALCPLLALTLLGPAPRLRSLVIWAGTLGGLVLMDVTVKWLLLGTPLPLSFYAKQPWYYRGFVGEFTWNPFWFLQVALAAVWPFLAAAMLLSRGTGVRLLLVLIVPAAATLAALFSVNQIMGHLGRFYFPALPLFVAAGALVTDRWVRGLPETLASTESAPRLAQSLLVRLACALLALLGGAQALQAAGRAYQGRAQTQELASLDGYRISAAEPLPDLDSWRASQEIAILAAEAPAGTTFAMSEHGLVGARAPRAVITDLLGLHDPIFARNGFSAAELWRRQPDVIWMPHPDHTQMLRDILDSDELWQHYVFYPDAFTYGLALRQDGPHYAILADLFARRWQAAYAGLRPDDYVARQSRK